MDVVLAALVLKVVLTASIVVIASVAGERFGPFWGALITCVPVSAGPAYVLIALEHDAAFVAASALASFIAVSAAWLFQCSFVRLGRHFGIVATLAGALILWLAAALAIREIAWTFWTAAACNIVVFLLAMKFTPAVNMTGASTPHAPQPWYELPVRALLVGVFVVSIAAVSGLIGSSATGIAAVFPLATSSLAIVMARRFGMIGAMAALSASVQPMAGIALAFGALTLTAETLGKWPALGVALVVSMIWPTTLAILRRRALRGS